MDKYEQAAAYFKAHPGEIFPAWNKPSDHPHGCIFMPLPHSTLCLTEIRRFDVRPETAERYAEVIADKRIPNHGSNITLDNIDVFVEWNQRLRPDTASQRT